MKFLIDAIKGFIMALADSVPGVSGSTVAFILGYYESFVNSIDDLTSKDKDTRFKAIKFLIKFFIGWGIGMCLAILVLTSIFENNIYAISSVFLGFVVFAIPIIIRDEKETFKIKDKKKLYYVLFALLGIIMVFMITYFNPIAAGGGSIDISNLSLSLIVYVFLAAVVAISAMVLPGISGSTLLLIFGLYLPTINAIKEVLHFNLSYIPYLLIFGLGLIVGIFLIVKIVRFLLTRFRTQTMYLILGLMIGSIYAIVMGPVALDVPMEALSLSTFNVPLFLVGGAVIIGLELLKRFIKKGEKDVTAKKD